MVCGCGCVYHDVIHANNKGKSQIRPFYKLLPGGRLFRGFGLGKKSSDEGQWPKDEG